MILLNFKSSTSTLNFSGFSGGVDSVLVTLALHAATPSDTTIDLVNVAFGEDEQVKLVHFLRVLS